MVVRRGGFGHELLKLAVEGVAVAVGAGVGALASPAVGAIAQRAIDVFGPKIVERWLVYSRTMTRGQWETAVAEAASISADEARVLASEHIERSLPNASPEEKALAVRYLTAIPETIRRSLLSNPATGALSVPRSISTDNPPSLLQLLPIDPPPYVVPCPLEGTHFQLDELVGVGGFGVVYKASSQYEQNLPRAIKFCLDPSMRTVFQHELDLLERLKSDAARLPEQIVRLYGYSIEADRPFLVYEYVPGGDLHDLLQAHGGEDDVGLHPTLALELMQDIVEPLAYTHQRGLVHRDLKPANILLRSRSLEMSQVWGHNSIKITDFGIGGVAVATTIDRVSQAYVDSARLSSTDQVNMLRGSGTPLYMSEEQARGDPPDPRHDIYSLGVIWYQLLMGNPSLRMGPAWEQRLELKNAPKSHVDVIKRCVGMFETRPRNAEELLELMPGASVPPPESPPEPPPTPTRKFCINCGTQTRPNVRFCHNCGHQL